MHVVRVATQNIWGHHGDWPSRRPVLRDGLAGHDLVALQEAFDDQPRELLEDLEVAHRDASGVAIGSRWPIARTHEPASDTLVAEIDAPFGRLVFANHAASYELTAEHRREREAVALARLIEDLGPEHAILAGDLNATPDSASVRFLLGLQSLDGTSVAYRDAWQHDEPGHTFTPENPTMPTGEGGKWALEPGRRIDYVLVRCSDHGPTLDVRRCERLFDEEVGRRLGERPLRRHGRSGDASALIPSHAVVVTGPTLTLRYATADDAPRLLELASDPDVTQWFSWGPYERLDQPEAYIAGLEDKRERGELLDFLVVHPEAGPIGVTGLSELAARDRRATVGTWFGRDWWGSGVNRESKAMITALAFRHLGIERLTAWANTRNGRSQVALERVGFRREGVLRGWHRHGDHVHDVVVFGMVRDEWEASPLADVPVEVAGEAPAAFSLSVG